jgi:hypothetical protein
VGWEANVAADIELVLSAPECALQSRDLDCDQLVVHPITAARHRHSVHPAAGRCGRPPCMGSVGASLDNALAES